VSDVLGTAQVSLISALGSMYTRSTSSEVICERLLSPILLDKNNATAAFKRSDDPCKHYELFKRQAEVLFWNNSDVNDSLIEKSFARACRETGVHHHNSNISKALNVDCSSKTRYNKVDDSFPALCIRMRVICNQSTAMVDKEQLRFLMEEVEENQESPTLDELKKRAGELKEQLDKTSRLIEQFQNE
jgi:hypothetical protein